MPKGGNSDTKNGNSVVIQGEFGCQKENSNKMHKKTTAFYNVFRSPGDTEFPFYITEGEVTQNFREKDGSGGMKPSSSRWSRTLCMPPRMCSRTLGTQPRGNYKEIPDSNVNFQT